MKGGKQTDIATFFGGKPKASMAPSDASGGKRAAAASKRKSEPTAEVEPAVVEEAPHASDTKPTTAAAITADDRAPKHKRLRKASGEEAAAAPAPAAVADLEDSDEENSGHGGNANKHQEKDDAAAQAANKMVVDEQQAAALRLAVMAEESEASESELEEAEDSGSPPPGDVAGARFVMLTPNDTTKAGKKKKPKAPAKSPVVKSAGVKAKVDGVGTLAIKAAAEHGTFDLSTLVNWQPGQPVPFAFLADTFEAIADESKRLIITGLLVNAFRAVIATTPADLLPMVYLCTNRVAPAHAGLELGIGDATLVKALAQATGRKESAIKADYDSSGDLGVVAAASRATQRTMFAPPQLTVAGVFKSFKDIAEAEGAKSQDRKRGLIVKLLVGAKHNEAGYVMRALQGKLRIGLAEQTVLVALAHAALLQRDGVEGSADTLAGRLERAAQTVKAVYSECPSYDELIPALLSAPIEDLPKAVHFKPGVPVKPMLAKPTTGVSEVLDKFANQPFTCEYKYDGERAQIHVLEDGTVKIYSRNSEDNTGKYPDIAAMVPEALAAGVNSVVLDAEAVAWDPKEKKVLPFQILSTRARKDVALDNIKVPVCVFVFDCLYLDGKALLKESLTARREAMNAALRELPGRLEFAISKTSHDVEELSAFLDEAVEKGTEGLIVKTLDDGYEPSKRSSHWLKLKKDYLDGVGDTFDLVPIGAWYGRGKRTGVYGSYLLAVYDAESEEYQSITKIGTGFSEELLKQLAEQMGQLTVSIAPMYYRSPETLTPDVWFSPKAVWEVKAADLSISPVHRAAAGLVDEAKGISIRFPRLVRVRDDKGPEDSTSPEQIAEMYRKQAVLQKAVRNEGGEDALE